MEYFLNIMGSEWMIIIFVALILLFGTNKLPEAGKKIGKMVGEYNKAKTEMQNQINDMTKAEPENLRPMLLSLLIQVKLKINVP